MQWPPATPTIARLFRYPGCTAQCGRCAQSIKRIMDEPQRPANEHRSDSCPRGDWALSGNGHRPRSGRARRGPVSGSRVRRSNRVTWRTGVIAGRMMQRCRRGTVQPAGGPTGRLAFGTELRAVSNAKPGRNRASQFTVCPGSVSNFLTVQPWLRLTPSAIPRLSVEPSLSGRLGPGTAYSRRALFVPPRAQGGIAPARPGSSPSGGIDRRGCHLQLSACW
jgi:hypothetical protein